MQSWGYMLDNGATTFWENWKGGVNTFSHNHLMLGSVSEWFYHWLGGIHAAPNAVGFDRIIIRPQIVNGSGKIDSRHGGLIFRFWTLYIGSRKVTGKVWLIHFDRPGNVNVGHIARKFPVITATQFSAVEFRRMMRCLSGT